MKNLLSLFILSVLLFSCEDTEENSPAFQANVENTFFKSTFTKADYFPFGDFFILQGRVDDELITLRGKYPPLNEVLEFGGESENFATFENNFGVIYSTTHIENGGSMMITNIGSSKKIITGEFSFTAVNSISQDTITVNKGVFFEVPYEELLGDITGGHFICELNGDPFAPLEIISKENGSLISISGIVNQKEIEIKVPNDVTFGVYELPLGGFSASYTNASVTQDAVFGTIIINTHIVSERKLVGKFSFLTETNEISSGEFVVVYQ